MSTAMIGAAPTSRASWTMWVPRPPTPHTPTDSPMPTLPVRTTAPYGVDTASARIAACSIGTLSGILVSPNACATVYSAHAPS